MEYFAVRDAPAPNGEVIAIWRKEDKNHQLIFGVKDVVTREDTRREDRRDENPFGATDEKAIEYYLMDELTEPEFSVMDTICDIPHIISDGSLHHLGVLKWHMRWHEFLGGWNCITRTGTVYAKIFDISTDDARHLVPPDDVVT